MAHPKSGSELSPGSSRSPEVMGKHYFKQAWAYSQRIETESRATSHPFDLYSPKLEEARRKLREKCVQILLLSCSYRRKAEELLWKKGFYELTQRSKSNKQALDGSSPLYRAYSEHLSMATDFYTQLLDRLEEHYCLPVTSMEHSQLTVLDANNADAQWLKDAAYRCLLYLGDLARYRVDIGGKPYTAITHYLHAISLDPTNGAPFNQLAALSGDKHEGLDAVYFYLRSISSDKPFPGAEVNLQRILRKTSERLEALRGNKDRATETNIREATQSLLLVRLVTLQYMLSSSEEDKRSLPQANSLTSFCEVLLSDLEECLNFDLQLFKDMTPACVSHVLSSGRVRERGGGRGEGEEEEVGDHKKVEELACLPHDLLLKVVSLCILSSTQLRSQGSAQTPTLTSFAVSVFSLLLHHSFLRLTTLTHHMAHTLTRGTTVTPTRTVGWAHTPDPKQPSEEANMVGTFLDHLQGEVLDEYAPQTPGIAKQLRVNKTSSATVGLDEAVNRLTIGPSQVWGGREVGREVARGSKSASSIESRGRRMEGGVAVGEAAKGSDDHSEKSLSVNREAAEKNEKASGKSRAHQKEKSGRNTKVVDRRRRRRHRRPDWNMTPLSSEEEEEGSEESDSSQSSVSTSLTLSNSSTEEDGEEGDEESVDRIDSLSETSLSDSEEGVGIQAVGVGPDPKPWTSQMEESGNVERKDGEKKEGRPAGGKRQFVLAANFSGSVQATPPTGRRVREEPKSSAEATDDHLFQTLLLQTRHQTALHLACSLAAEDSYLMPVKIFSDWITEHPLVLTVCAQGSPSLWSRLASLLNFLPPAQEIIAAGLRATLSPGMEWSQTNALREDVLLRGFAPLVKTHQRLKFDVISSPDILEQACNRICVLQKFGRHVSKTKTTALFEWHKSGERFMAPLQRDSEEKRAAAVAQSRHQEKAAESRSKLMKAMAQRRLQAEVDSLVETSAQQQEATVFTPYLLPDAQSLCTGLHLVRKLIASEKFIVIIAKSVIDALDSMKKGRENYAAREAIKFLERNLQGGGKMMRVQTPEETLQSPGARKPPKIDLNTWRYSCLVDCALYFTHTFAERGSSGQSATTLLLDQSIVKLMEGVSKEISQLSEILCEAQLNGVSINTVVRFHGKWLQSQSSSRRK